MLNHITIRQPVVNLSARLEFDLLPTCIEQAEAILAKHVCGCRHCLAVALCRTETLAETGCDEYQYLLNRLKAGVELHSGGHIKGPIAEEYCMNHLSASDRQQVDDHIGTCHRCEKAVRRASGFVSHMKAALSISLPTVHWAAEHVTA
jgi:hypothetical protein